MTDGTRSSPLGEAIVTGDLVDDSVEELAEHVASLAKLKAKDGVFFVTRNHEYYSGADKLARAQPTSRGRPSKAIEPDSRLRARRARTCGGRGPSRHPRHTRALCAERAPRWIAREIDIQIGIAHPGIPEAHRVHLL